MESMVISALYKEVSENTAKVHNSVVTGGSYSLASASRCNTFPITRLTHLPPSTFRCFLPLQQQPLTSSLQPIYYFQTALLPVKLNAVHLQPIIHTAYSYSLTDSHLEFNITSMKINQHIINKMHML